MRMLLFLVAVLLATPAWSQNTDLGKVTYGRSEDIFVKTDFSKITPSELLLNNAGKVGDGGDKAVPLADPANFLKCSYDTELFNFAAPAHGELIQYDPANPPKMTSLSDIFGDDLPIIPTRSIFIHRPDGTKGSLRFAYLKQADGSMKWEQVLQGSTLPPAHYVTLCDYTIWRDDSQEHIDRWLAMLNKEISPQLAPMPLMGNSLQPFDSLAGPPIPDSNISGGLNTVPEPSTFVLLAIGLSLIGLKFRKR